MREAARRQGRQARYDGRWRDREPCEAPPGVKPVIRLKAAQTGETVLEDRVQGRVTWSNSDLDDLVLLRSDGTPTYMLAVVVDDHDMGVTHIIRGDDHLTNAARQMQIYQALDWPVPVMAHIPLIHGPDGAKLSKRHGALGIDAYRAQGYLPAALRNYLVRLGWSQGDKEFFSTEEMIAGFDLPSVGRSAARFDFAKLENMNGHYLRAMSDADLLQTLIASLPFLPNGAALAARLDAEMAGKLLRAMPGLKERAKTLVDLIEGARFLFAERPLVMDAKAQEILDHGGRAHLAGAAAGARRARAMDSRRRSRMPCASMPRRPATKLGQVAQPLRAARYRAGGFAGHFRCPRRARSGGKPGTAARSGSQAMSFA